MNDNSNQPQMAPERLEQMISLALSHAQEPKVTKAPRGNWNMLDWLRTPALVPIPVRAFTVVAVLAVVAFQLMPATPHNATHPQTATETMATNTIADTDAYGDVSDYMLLALLDDLS